MLPFHCGPGASRCLAYSAVVKDTGSFRTYRFALTPNQFIPGRHIRSVVTGRVDGSYSFAFFASTTPHAFIVPRFFSGPFFAVAGWPKLFFPIGTRFSPVLITCYQITYGAWTGAGRSAGSTRPRTGTATCPSTGTSAAASGAKTAVTCEPTGPYHGPMGFT
ncbi:MAG TPA: hypothetical protein VHS32_22180 [Streptosporangiaceae bacterium]|nr:hypothetical protein [Streptosporangiaceae bacterium]HEX3308968.1 hypothetical protein [Streptosporangiaceae bacterium]